MNLVERVETTFDPLTRSNISLTESSDIVSNETKASSSSSALLTSTASAAATTTTTTQPNTSKTNSKSRKRQVSITEVTFSVTVTGTSTKTDNKGKLFTVYNTKVSALGTRWVVPKRFSELELLNETLKKSYPQSRLPKFPSKGALGGLFRRLDDSTIEKRRSDLQTYLDGALANPLIYKSQLLRLFFEMPRGMSQASREAEEREQARALHAGSDGGGAYDLQHGSSEHDNFGGREKYNADESTGPKSVVLFSNQSKHPELSFDYQGMRLAIKNGNLETVQKILETDRKLGRYVDSAGQSMLHLACIFSHSEIAMILLDAGADPELKNSHGEMAFDLAPPALAQRMIQFIADWEAENGL